MKAVVIHAARPHPAEAGEGGQWRREHEIVTTFLVPRLLDEGDQTEEGRPQRGVHRIGLTGQ